MYIPCTYMARIISLCHEQEIQKEKILQRAGYEPTIVCITASCLNHYATSMLASDTIVTVHVYCFTWLGRLVTRRRTSRPPRPRGSHDVACPSINMDLFKAEVCGEAGLAEIAFGPKQPSARARSQVDLEVREFRSSKLDWRARARTSHKIRFDAIAKHNKTI